MKFALCILAVAFSFLCVGCYRMPTDDDVSLLPATNNPNLTRQTGSTSPMPSISY